MAQATSGLYKQSGILHPPRFSRESGAKGTVFEAGPATLSGTVEDYSTIRLLSLGAEYKATISAVLPGFGGLINGSRVIYRLTRPNGDAAA